MLDMPGLQQTTSLRVWVGIYLLGFGQVHLVIYKMITCLASAEVQYIVDLYSLFYIHSFVSHVTYHYLSAFCTCLYNSVCLLVITNEGSHRLSKHLRESFHVS